MDIVTNIFWAKLKNTERLSLIYSWRKIFFSYFFPKYQERRGVDTFDMNTRLNDVKIPKTVRFIRFFHYDFFILFDISKYTQVYIRKGDDYLKWGGKW